MPLALSEYVQRSDLVKLFHVSMKDAAKELNMSESSLRNICRKHRIGRWPYRKFQQIDAHLAALRSDIVRIKKRLRHEKKITKQQQQQQQQQQHHATIHLSHVKPLQIWKEMSKTQEMIDSLVMARAVLEDNPNLTLELAIIESNKRSLLKLDNDQKSPSLFSSLSSTSSSEDEDEEDEDDEEEEEPSQCTNQSSDHVSYRRSPSTTSTTSLGGHFKRQALTEPLSSTTARDSYPIIASVSPLNHPSVYYHHPPSMEHRDEANPMKRHQHHRYRLSHGHYHPYASQAPSPSLTPSPSPSPSLSPPLPSHYAHPMTFAATTCHGRSPEWHAEESAHPSSSLARINAASPSLRKNASDLLHLHHSNVGTAHGPLPSSTLLFPPPPQQQQQQQQYHTGSSAGIHHYFYPSNLIRHSPNRNPLPSIHVAMQSFHH